MYSISKKFKMEYAHRLHLMPVSHQCRNIHGHSGEVVVTLTTGGIDYNGFVVEFGDLRFIKSWIDLNWDHALFISDNDEELMNLELQTKRFILPKCYCQTSSEHLAKYLCKYIKEYIMKLGILNKFNISVTFSETGNNTATYSE